jgi:hypothetical protein
MNSAIKNCITCEGKVSTNATTCPHCGEPNPARQEETKTQVDRADSPKRGVSKTHSVSAIAKSLLDSAVDIGASSSASPETSSIPNDVVLFLEDDKKRRNKKNAIALILFVIFWCFVITANIHIISGSGISFPKIVKKESFGFKETFINIDEITSMPSFSASSLHPIGLRVLQNLGYIESDDEHRGRIKKELKEEMDKALEIMHSEGASQ